MEVIRVLGKGDCGLVNFKWKTPLIKGYIHCISTSLFVTYNILGMISGISHSYAEPHFINTFTETKTNKQKNRINSPKVTQLVSSRVQIST